MSLVAPRRDSTRRAMQDYTSWVGFGTAAMWADMQGTPALALEIACQHVSKLGCINPSEGTSAEVAATALVVQWGTSALAMVSQADIDKMFADVKAYDTHNMCESTLAVTTASVLHFAYMLQHRAIYVI